MRGQVLTYDPLKAEGLISAEDGSRYGFTGSEWKGAPHQLRSGAQIDFSPDGSNALAIYAVGGSTAGSVSVSGDQKSPIVAGLLALFLGGLRGVEDPEAKRKFIGKTFVEVFEEEAAKIGGADFLAQGTLYPDVIESVSFTGGPSVTIKSHHNVGGLPERMDMKLVEPLRELFKDEVRNVGRELGLPEELVARHPFPGPGLAVRMLGEITRDGLDVLREADAIYLEEIRSAGLYDDIWQAFAVLLPVRSVGVMGDARTYENVCALRAVTSRDGMTADWYPFPHDVLGRISTRIINEVEGVNRVCYDISSKPPATIEWE